jgi:DNA polymerase III epsilon subunit-like protein
MSLDDLHGNVMCAVDVETTGTEFGFHEVIQVAFVPLDENLEPHPDLKFFYMNVAPYFPERQTLSARMKHGLDANKLAEECLTQEQAADLLDAWFMKLNLPLGKRLVPLAHNYAFERGFLTHWLGLDTFDNMIQCHPRDTMIFGALLNDLSTWHGGPKSFPLLALPEMCKLLGVKLDNAHDALADSLATARCYREILRLFG